jgi:hypothetical protein
VSPTPPYDQAVARISLAGTTQVPISWRLSGGAQDIALATQRYLALQEILKSGPDPAQQTWLIDYVATGQVATIEHQSFDNKTAHGKWTGPLWLWLGQPQARPDGKATVPICRDLGWYYVDKLTKPRPNRYVVELATLVPVRVDDGPARWKVTLWNPKADAGTVWEAGCEAWAVHTP